MSSDWSGKDYEPHTEYRIQLEFSDGGVALLCNGEPRVSEIAATIERYRTDRREHFAHPRQQGAALRVQARKVEPWREVVQAGGALTVKLGESAEAGEGS